MEQINGIHHLVAREIPRGMVYSCNNLLCGDVQHKGLLLRYRYTMGNVHCALCLELNPVNFLG